MKAQIYISEPDEIDANVVNSLLTNYDCIRGRFKFLGREVASIKVGLIGYGNIARLVHTKLKALGCTTFFTYDPYIDPAKFPDSTLEFFTNIDEILDKADVVSIHVPLSDS